MARFVILFLVFGITIYALIDCARRDESEVKALPKWGWLLVIILIGPQALAIGPIAYLIAGRIRNSGGGKPKRRILPPDDDPDFLRKI
ncbi:MAG: PLDc_N domain-containing protein [Actinobacteria bacterium]|jgi:hypothetical protein|nr:PLDc_N domain-containing protein [Actinomycetota bacterium]NCX38885.1 PLDc_N domain-containing protein [Actinomycetota bacterium]NCZ61315.1 PLDc_N domain-containing protein [Actinomycetota bacterium]NDA45046.1 PLDc_N domain-containing protein [Actinomycetota bacterium]NDC17370.1 PLDc_N domain-containing protein [Actinomycetota bacterium]